MLRCEKEFQPLKSIPETVGSCQWREWFTFVVFHVPKVKIKILQLVKNNSVILQPLRKND